MTTYELGERLARRLKQGSLPLLSPAAAQDIVEAMNAGLQECYELLPHWQRRTTISLELAAPATLNLALTQGSVDLGGGGGVFTEAHVGRSVVVMGDATWNEVQSTTKLLDAYRGATGTRSATIYGDSTYSDIANFDGLSSHPRLAHTVETLEPFNARLAGLVGEIGLPRFYWAEPAAAALGTTPAVYLRVYPAPDQLYLLRVDAEFRPSLVTFATLHQAVVVPLADRLLHAALIPLCEEALLRSPEWAHDAKAHLVAAAAESARDFLSRQRPAVVVPSNRVFTPAGY